MTIWEHDNMTIWEHDNKTIWEHDNKTIWEHDKMKIKNKEIVCESIKTWELANMIIDNIITW